MSLPGSHPHFDDQRSAFWHLRLSDGLGAAREAGARVLLVLGRLTCGGSRALLEKTIPKEEIAEFLNEHFVCVAADADAPEPAVEEILARLPRREPTPVCVYLGPEGQVLHSTVGGRPPAVFLRDMSEANARKEPMPGGGPTRGA